MVNSRPASSEGETLLSKASLKATHYHGKVPYLRKLPLRAIVAISSLIVVNLLVWVAVGVVLHFHPALISTAVLAYTLGLRHALDADHISAIDLMTRRLVATGQRPVTVGMFFSLGHSTIVIITCLVVAGTTAAVSDRFDRFSHIGGIIGSSVSAAFLILLGIMNIYILWKLIVGLKAAINQRRRTGHQQEGSELMNMMQGGGIFFRIFKSLFSFINKPWKMYPLGVLFGLGFDTSSEIALLGLAALQASKGTSIWLILIFPILFTAGMCLLDTTDGALMMSLYTSTALANDHIAILYYSIVLTVVTVVVAIVIGILQLLTMLSNILGDEASGPFWDGIAKAGDSYDIIGAAICGTFIVAGVTSLIVYRPWRRRVDERRRRLGLDEPEEEDEGVLSTEAEDFIATAPDPKTAARGPKATDDGGKAVVRAQEQELLDDNIGPAGSRDAGSRA